MIHRRCITLVYNFLAKHIFRPGGKEPEPAPPETPSPPPDDDGWIRHPNGDRTRKAAGRLGFEMGFCADNHDAPRTHDEPRTGGSLTKNNPFDGYGL